MTAVWLVLAVFLAAWAATRGASALVGLCLVLSVFQAAAALSLGGTFIQPAFVILLILNVFIIWRATDQQEARWLLNAVRLNALPLLFSLYCVLSAIILPRIFAGSLVVFPLQSSEFPGQELARFYLRPEPTNLTQSLYAMLCLAASICATYAATREGTLRAIRTAVPVAVAIVVAVGAVQWVVRFAGMPFKPAFLYNNTGVALLLDQQFGAIPRINATFIEPSSVAVGLAPLVGYLLTVSMIDNQARRLTPLGLAGAAVLVLTTSTTAYLSLAIAILSLIIVLATHDRGRFLPGAMVVAALGAALIGVVLVALWILVPEIREPVSTIFTATVSDKAASSSAVERGTWNAQAWQNMLDTFGLGTGFGSSRASGLIFVLLGTVGVPGLLLFVAMVGQALLPGRHDATIWSADLAGLKVGVMTAAVTLMVSGAELTTLPFWLMLGTLAVNRLPQKVDRQHYGLAAAGAGTVPASGERLG